MTQIFQAHRRDTGEPVEFPVDWRSSEEATLVWRWDAEHNAYPVTPLSEEFSRRDASGTASARFMGGRGLNIHGYRYSARGLGGGGFSRQDDEGLAPLVPRIDELWEGDWLPRIEREALAVTTANYEALSLPELVERMEEAREAVGVHMDLMFRAMDIVSYARNQLAGFLREVLGTETDIDALILELIEGFDNASLRANAGLWDIAQMSSRTPELRSLIETAGGATLFKRLDAVSGGPELAEALHVWLDRDGRRSGDYGELAMPTLQEDLPTVLNLLRAFLDREDPREAMYRSALRRQALAERLEGKMTESKREQFRELLADAGKYIPVKESRNGVICISRGSLRAPSLAAGRKLVDAGVLDEVEDVFFLTFAEIAGALDESGPQLRGVIPERRRDHEYWRNVVPPPSIGNAAGEAAVEDEHIIKGVGASKGIARGVARVITTLEDSVRLQPGEILVARTTTSAWTPLFLTAAAVVTDGGGMLSHCAVVAREYQLPSVVGAYTATHKIRDGATITVDGTTGIIMIEPD